MSAKVNLRIAAVVIFLLIGSTAQAQSAPTLSERASQALFEQSDSRLALQLSKAALKRDRHDVNAAFVAMEAAAMQADDAEVLDAALATVGEADTDDPRRDVAVARIEALAANSATFRSRLARLRKLASSMAELRFAMVAAANDGAPEIDQLEASREAGLVTDWRVAGPFGHHPLLDFDKSYGPETDALRNRRYSGHDVERFQFPTGRFVLPDYFSRRGVFYAASDIYLSSDGMWNVYIETGGTAKVFVDGTPATIRDERRPEQAQMVRSLVHLSQGHHRVLVKFTPSASPFRVALLPPTGNIHRKQNIPVLTASPESEYATASLELSRGNLVEAFRHAKAEQQLHDSAAVRWLLARCWQKVSEDAAEQEQELRAALALDASASRVELALAQTQFRADHTRQGLALLKKATADAAQNESVLKAEAREFSRLDWRPEATTAVESLAAEHPSCENLSLAASFYASQEKVAEARRYEDRLLACAPNSLDGVRALSHRGDHVHAAQAALKVAAATPLDRASLELAVRELMLTGDAEAAARVARQLVELAPNAVLYQRFLQTVERGSTLLDDQRSAPLALLAPFRRDGLETVRQTASKRFTGGPALWTLNDAIVVQLNGVRWLYSHRIVRLLDRDGVLSYGEVAIPANAEVLHLRTISATGEITEPEFNQHKATVSMSALAPGDSIEEEFLQRVTGEETRFEFGSWDAPILYSRFTLIAPQGVRPDLQPSKPTTSTLVDGLVASTWESDDIAQPSREVALPTASQFPAVVLDGDQPTLAALRDHVQAQMMAASVPGPRTFMVANRLKAATEEQTVRRLYNYVFRSVEGDGAGSLQGDIVTAEDSLEDHDGDRAAALLALARAADIDARLYLVRDIGASSRPSAYLHPIVEFVLADGRRLAADLEDEGLPLGALNPAFDTTAALPIVSFDGGEPVLSTEVAANLKASAPEERSVADARVDIDGNGNLSADVTIHMAPWRASQMRGVLRTVNAPDRQRFFQQLAMRLFPGATESAGSVANESDPELPLVIHVTCSAPGFLDLRRQVVDIDQITPALGLRSMYAKSSSRNFPLAIDAVLFELSVFHVSLPEGVTVAKGMQAEVKSEFGSYSTSVRQVSAHSWEMKRDFNIRMQVIEPQQYPAFAGFANRIDSIERERLSLRVQSPSLRPARTERAGLQ